MQKSCLNKSQHSTLKNKCNLLTKTQLSSECTDFTEKNPKPKTTPSHTSNYVHFAVVGQKPKTEWAMRSKFCSLCPDVVRAEQDCHTAGCV